MSPPKVETRPKARTSSMPRPKAASASFSANKRSAPSISPVRNTSTETSPIRSYVSSMKDFSNYTPLRLSREKVSQSYSKIVYKGGLNASVSSSSEDIPKLRSRATALDSLNDLKTKTDRLDAESKKFAEKVSQIKQRMGKEAKQQPQLAMRRGKKDGNLIRTLARTTTKLVSRACYPLLRAALDRCHERAERIAALERQSVRFHTKLRLKNHFSVWKSAFQVKEIEELKLSEVAFKHYHLQLTLSSFAQWKEATRWSKLRPEDRKRRADISTVLSASAKPTLDSSYPRAASVSPKPSSKSPARPAPARAVRKPATRSPTLSPKPSATPPPKRGVVTPKREVTIPKLHKKTASSPISQLEGSFDDTPAELLAVADEHYRASSKVTITQFYRGLKPWKAAVVAKAERARKHYRKKLGMSIFQSWLEFYVESCEARNAEDEVEATSPAESDDSTAQYDDILAAFRLVTARQQTLGPRILQKWREFVTLSHGEKEQEHRRNLMWKKVNSWLDQYKSTDSQAL